MSTIWRKRVLQEGRGLYCPNELASVEVNVMGKYCTSDDDGGTQEMFDQREKASMELGAVASPLSYKTGKLTSMQLHRATDQHVVSRGQTLSSGSEKLGSVSEN